MTLLRRETPAFAQQKWPGGTLHHYGLCEMAQRQAVFVRKDKSSGRAIKSDRAKVVMTAGCISKNCGIINYTCREKELGKSEFIMVMYIAGLQKIIQLDNLEGGI